MSNKLGTIADFIIKVVIMFTVILALLFFANQYPVYSLVFSAIALLYILAIIVKGLVDIFYKE